MFIILKKGMRSLIMLSVVIIMLTMFSCLNYTCVKKTSPLPKSESKLRSASEPTQRELVIKAKSFLKIYLIDYDTFIKGSDDLQGNRIKAELQHSNNRWYVYFTNGFHDLHVELNRNATLGTVYSTYGPYVSTLPITNKGKYHDRAESPETLFSLNEFEKVMEIPHNKSSLGRH